MYWVDPNASCDEVKGDLAEIRAHGFNLIRAFIFWDELEPFEGELHFERFDMLMDAAADQGLGVLMSFGWYLPSWLEEKLEKEYGYRQSDRYACFDLPLLRAEMERVLRLCVRRYANHKALKRWNVWNEPEKPPCKCPHTLEKFLVWLKERYPSIDELSKAWYAEHCVVNAGCLPKSYDGLTLEWLRRAIAPSNNRKSTPLRMELLRFATFNIAENLKFLADIVRECDPSHPVHVNLKLPMFNSIALGQNEYLLAKETDELGVSVHHWFNSQLHGASASMAFDFVLERTRSWALSAGKRPWLSELQAGGTSYSTATGARLQSEILRAFGHGMDGAILWQWHSWRAGVFEVGDFSLRHGATGAPTERSEAMRRLGAMFEERRDFLLNVKDLPARECAIVFSDESVLLKWMKHSPCPDPNVLTRDTQYDVACAAFGCYKALMQAGIHADIVPETVSAEQLSRYKTVYWPHAQLITPQLAETLKKYVAQGGRLYADGRAGFLTGNVFLSKSVPALGLNDVFGAEECDFFSYMEGTQGRNVISLEDGAALPGDWFEQKLKAHDGAKVIGRFADGEPAVVVNEYGKGRTMLVGAPICWRYFDSLESSVQRFIAGFAEIKPKVSLDNPFVTWLSRESVNGPMLLLTNHSDTAQTVHVSGTEGVFEVNLPPGPCTSIIAPDARND